MKKVDMSKVFPGECTGIQINGFSHCKTINCKWQGLSACEGQRIIRTGYNRLGYRVGEYGIVENEKIPVE